jgi:CheY-like chemotaxis protein
MPSRILIVDDNHFSALALLTQLQQYNIECELAEDGLKAIQMIKDKVE